LGTNFYRLKAVNKDGSVEYSNTQQVNVEASLSESAIFPNPSQDELFINLNEYQGQEGSIEIMSIFGQLQSTVALDKIPSDLVKLDTSNLIDGVYLLKIKIGEGDFITKQFMVTK